MHPTAMITMSSIQFLHEQPKL